MEAKFTIGDKVIALSSSVNNEQLRVKGNSYTVNAVGYCSGCGSQIINVSGDYCAVCQSTEFWNDGDEEE